MIHASKSFCSALLLALAALAGCTTVETTTTGSTIVPPDRRSGPPAVGSASHTSVSLRNLGSIPYDGFTLPLVSPNGTYVATQSGVAPTWATLLGHASGTSPRASGIDVFSIDPTSTSGSLRKSFSLKRGYVLGRSANNDGFLVEAPQPDGSRRIGFVRWSASVEVDASEGASQEPTAPQSAPALGEPEWLAADERVNIFGALGPGGALAWCARSPNETELHLVVRRGDAIFEIPAEEAQSWMLPTFAADGTLFAFRVRDGIAEIAHAATDDGDAFEQSLVVERISVRADAQRVWQAMAPVDTASAVEPASVAGANPLLYLRSVDLGRMATWTPGTPGVRPLADSSFAVVVGQDGTMLWSDGDGVVAVPPSRVGSASDPIRARRLDGPRVYDRPAVPRRIDAQPSSFILLVPDGRSIAIVRITLVTPPQLVGRADSR